MKNTKTKATAIALTALMAASTLGAATVSAAEMEQQDTLKTIYLVNNKDWANVYGYTWNNDGTVKNAEFPGEQLECVGTTTAGNFGSAKEVFEITVNIDKYDKLIFAEGGEHGQQSKDFDLHCTEQCGFYLDKDNNLDFIRDFSKGDIKTTEATCEANSITPSSNACFEAGQNGNTLYIDTNGVTNSKPQVTLSNLNCTLTNVNVEPQILDGKTVEGMYVADVPQGYYYGATVTVDGQTYGTNINNTTDSVKLSSHDGDISAESCQRVFFSNTLSSKSMANQIIRIYSWNGATNKSETTFNDAPKMTYYGNNEMGQNMYFYDVPASYDHIVVFSKDFTNNNITAKTADITLGYSINTANSIIMTGYYTTTSDSDVATYSMQVTK